jgi:hypothetical protein
MAQDKRAILEEIPEIKRLKEELPGQFLGYIDTPVSDAPSESEAGDESALAQGGEAAGDQGSAGEEDDF